MDQLLGPATKQGTLGSEDLGFISRLAKLGLRDADLVKLLSMLHNPKKEDRRDDRNGGEAALATAEPPPGKPLSQQQAITLCLVEEQQILLEAYRSFMGKQSEIELLMVSSDASADALAKAAEELDPAVLLLGVKTLQAATVEKLAMVREVAPQVALVVLFAVYDDPGLKALRDFSRDASGGCAYVLKHTIDTLDQVLHLIRGAAEGRIIVDPTVMEGLISTIDTRSGAVGQLSPKELEVLSWIAKGYRNETIAETLSRDVKTVERHINNIYGKLQDGDQTQHPRVRAALSYLKATGMVAAQDLS